MSATNESTQSVNKDVGGAGVIVALASVRFLNCKYIVRRVPNAEASEINFVPLMSLVNDDQGKGSGLISACLLDGACFWQREIEWLVIRCRVKRMISDFVKSIIWRSMRTSFSVF